MTTAKWFGPIPIATGFASGAPVATGYQGTQLDAFVPGTDGTMKVLWVNGVSAWYGPNSMP